MAAAGTGEIAFPDISPLYEDAADAAGTVPVHLLREGETPEVLAPEGRRWLEQMRFTPSARRQITVPGPDGGLAAVVLGAGNGMGGEPCGPSGLLVGQLASSLPPGSYRLSAATDPTLSAIAWGLGGYRFRRYRSSGNGEASAPARLVWPEGCDRRAAAATVESVWFARDLINTPASDLGPEELAAAAKVVADRHGARFSVTVGDDLLSANLPMIHAVGRASSRAPRLIDIRWSPPGSAAPPARRLTLVGKGICFDTGGLDIKPASNMLLMKKDMGGAASALALGHMIMSAGLPVGLRILISAAENSIAGNAFRPSDVLTSRSGRTVEVGNTDAEGRLVLADALTLACEEKPDILISLATLTGAARAALGPDLPAFFCDDDSLASRVLSHGAAIGDPMWRMPFWNGYERNLDSEVADMSNVSEGPFAGAITAALFLRRFANGAGRYAHVDLYGWRSAPRSLGPKGGEAHAARALFSALSEELAA